MFSVHSDDGTYIYAGEGARLLGWDPKDLIGKNPYVDFLPEEDVAAIAAGHEALMNEDEEVVFIYRYPDGKGGFQWVKTVTYGAASFEGRVTVAQTRPTAPQDAVEVRLARTARNDGPRAAYEAHEAD